MNIHLTKNALLLWRIRLTIGLAAAAFVSGALLFVFVPIGLCLISVTLAVYAAAFWYLLPALVRERQFGCDGKQLRLWYGVFVKRVMVVPVSRVQHTAITCTPVQKLLSLRSIIFYCAGANVSVIDITKAETMRLYAMFRRIEPL